MSRKCIFRRGSGCHFVSVVTTKAAAMRMVKQWRKGSKDGYWGLVLTDIDVEHDIARDAERDRVFFSLTADEKKMLKGGKSCR